MLTAAKLRGGQQDYRKCSSDCTKIGLNMYVHAHVLNQPGMFHTRERPPGNAPLQGLKMYYLVGWALGQTDLHPVSGVGKLLQVTHAVPVSSTPGKTVEEPRSCTKEAYPRPLRRMYSMPLAPYADHTLSLERPTVILALHAKADKCSGALRAVTAHTVTQLIFRALGDERCTGQTHAQAVSVLCTIRRPGVVCVCVCVMQPGAPHSPGNEDTGQPELTFERPSPSSTGSVCCHCSWAMVPVLAAGAMAEAGADQAGGMMQVQCPCQSLWGCGQCGVRPPSSGQPARFSCSSARVLCR